MSDFHYSGINLETDPFENASTSGQDDLVMMATIAIFTDAEASVDIEPPDGTQNRRGFWADTYEEDEWSTGSLMWLLDRAALTQDQRNLAKDYAEQALQFMVDVGLAASVEVTVEDNERNRVDLGVVIRQHDGSETATTYTDLWEVVKNG